jgi:hypothetical protein
MCSYIIVILFLFLPAEELLPCPTSVQQIEADDDFVSDKGIKKYTSKFLHPGTTSCYRSKHPR